MWLQRKTISSSPHGTSTKQVPTMSSIATQLPGKSRGSSGPSRRPSRLHSQGSNKSFLGWAFVGDISLARHIDDIPIKRTVLFK